MIRVLITGDRDFYCVHLARQVLDKMVARYGAEELTIVHGDAGGVDKAFNDVSEEMGIAVEPHSADWAKYGGQAGPLRNREMVRRGAGMCLAVHKYLKGSKGTKNCVGQCIDANIPVYLFETDSTDYFRVDRAYFESNIKGRS